MHVNFLCMLFFYVSGEAACLRKWSELYELLFISICSLRNVIQSIVKFPTGFHLVSKCIHVMWYTFMVCYDAIHELLMSLSKSDAKSCPVDALRACVFIYLLYILKNNVEFRRK